MVAKAFLKIVKEKGKKEAQREREGEEKKFSKRQETCLFCNNSSMKNGEGGCSS